MNWQIVKFKASSPFIRKFFLLQVLSFFSGRLERPQASLIILRRVAVLMVLLVLAGGLPACRATRAAPEKLVQLERTACMGPCPVDQLTVYTDGRLEYEGGAHAPRLGLYAGRLSVVERQQLVAKFEAANFFAFQDSYVAPVSDLPTQYLTYWQGDRTKRIRDYAGAPAALKELEAELIKLIEADRWQKTAPVSK